MTDAHTAFRDGREYPVVDVPCIKCTYPRSKNAPATMFYECCCCGHRFSREELEDKVSALTVEGEQERVERFKQMRQMIDEMRSSGEPIDWPKNPYLANGCSWSRRFDGSHTEIEDARLEGVMKLLEARLSGGVFV